MKTKNPSQIFQHCLKNHLVETHTILRNYSHSVFVEIVARVRLIKNTRDENNKKTKERRTRPYWKE